MAAHSEILDRPVDAAQALASMGFSVFPCRPRSKVPATAHGCKDATRDPAVIQDMFEDCNNIAIATGTASGVWVLDVDGEAGLAALADLEEKQGALPETVCQQTGGGGRQFFFCLNGERVHNRAKVSGRPIDVRGDGGYVVVPPSIHPSGQPYTWLRSPDSIPLAAAPGWLLDFITSRDIPGTTTQRGDVLRREAQDNRQTEVLAALLSMRVADENDGSRRLYASACRCVEWDLNDAEAVAVIQAYAHLRPFPRTWTVPQIVARLRDAERHVVRGMAHSRRAVEGAVEQTPPYYPLPQSADEFCTNHPEPEPALIEGILRCGGVAGIVSGSKCKKSHVLLHLLLSIANGRPWLGHATRQGDVLLIDLETQRGDWSRRIQVVAAAMGVTMEGLAVLPLRGIFTDIHALARHLIGSVERGRFAAIALDPLYKLTPDGADENSAADVGRVMARLDEIATATGAAVLAVHHSPKGDTSGRTTLDFGAGSGAFARAVDALIALRPHEQEDHAVLEVVCRSFREPPAVGLAWQYPLWEIDTALDVTKLRSGRAVPAGQKPLDAEGFARRFLSNAEVVWHATLLSQTAGGGIPERTARRLLADGIKRGLIKVVRSKKDRRRRGYRATAEDAL
jgi:hypothetical protein